MVRSRWLLYQRQALACRITRRRKFRCWRHDAWPIARCWKANDSQFRPLLLTGLPADFCHFPLKIKTLARIARGGIWPEDGPRTWLRVIGQYPKQNVISVPAGDCLSQCLG